MATSTTADDTTTELSMKLLIDTKTQQVLFAEAGKDVVDFFFSLLALPIATAAKLMIGQDSVAGSVGNLYTSVEKLDSTYVQAGADKKPLLHPTEASAAATASRSLLRLPAAAVSPAAQPKNFYRCHCQYTKCYLFVAVVTGTKCPTCNQYMTKPYYTGQANVQNNATATGGSVGVKGFVQDVVTYTVTDDLAVTPMSTISSITLHNTFGVRDLSDLQEKTVQIVCLSCFLPRSAREILDLRSFAPSQPQEQCDPCAM